MGLVKEYVDQAVQTETDTVLSPYADPAVVLAAPPLKRNGLAQDTSYSVPELSPPTSDSPYIVTPSPASPILTPLFPRRLSKRKLVRCPANDILSRRIVSMPEDKSETFSDRHSKRVVSMPDRIRQVLEPSAELSQPLSTSANDSFGSYSRHRERVRVFPAPSDVPQTPSPPSSPESLLIIAAGAQLPEGFLRRKYSPEPLVEEDEANDIALDWVAWANSPPRPIPALHGPLSLPYARCPSGAEGTIIEESDNVAQMIWGLGPDDQPHNQIRAEAYLPHTENTQNAPSHGPGHTLPRLQKKRTPTQQVSKSSRTQTSTHAKSSLTRMHRQVQDDRGGLLGQFSSDTENHPDIADALPRSEGPSTLAASDNLMNDPGVLPIDNNRVLEWQLARLQHALRTSLADMDSFSAHPGRLDPVLPASVASGFPQPYPRIFVESRPNEGVSPVTRQSSIELAQQYHQQQLCRQALQKQKLQMQSLLPTPPNSSSPQWSSHFSPYLAYCSTFSPELVGSPKHPVSVPSQKYRSGAHPSQYPRYAFDQHERGDINDFDTSPGAALSANVANSAASFGQASSSSSTLTKYIKQLQALSPIANFSPLQPIPPPNVPVPPVDECTIGPLQSIPTPPSPESPRTLSRSSFHNLRLFAPTRQMQRRLSSVPEEDGAFLGHSTSASPSRFQTQITTDHGSSSHDGATGHPKRYLEVHPQRKTAVPDLPGFESVIGTSSVAFHEASPVKVRLPANKEHVVREQANEQQEQNKGHQHVHRKKHRYRKLKGPITTSEQARPCGLVG